MRFVADISFTRHPLDAQLKPKKDVESSNRTWDNIEAPSELEAQHKAIKLLKEDEPNLIVISHITMKPYTE